MRAVIASALVLLSSAAWAQNLNGNPRIAPDNSGLGQFSAQVNCPGGQVFNPNTNQCVVPAANQDLTGYYIGGVLILSGVIGAIVLANNGDKTVSP